MLGVLGSLNVLVPGTWYLGAYGFDYGPSEAMHPASFNTLARLITSYYAYVHGSRKNKEQLSHSSGAGECSPSLCSTRDLPSPGKGSYSFFLE